MRRSLLFLVLPMALFLAGCHAAAPERYVVYFEAKSSHLDLPARGLVATIAERARQRPGVAVVVSGYSGPNGTAADNLALAAQRSQAVADALIAAGVDPARIQRHAAGGLDYTLDSIESRRVEITLGAP